MDIKRGENMSKKYITIFAASIAVIFIVGFYSCRTSDRQVEKDTYDVVIIGSGPGGLTAGIYTSRAMRSTVIFEGDDPGGLLTKNPEVENWPGEKNISGYDLMEKIRDHAKHAGCDLVSEYMTDVDLSELPYKVFTRSGKVYKAKSLIIAMGVERRKLGCPGEKEYWAKGVSACATCDAPFFRNKTVVVVGGGATALTEAHHLSHYAKEVTVFYRGGHLKTIDPIKYTVRNDANVDIRYNSIIKEIKGNGKKVTDIVIVEHEGTPAEREFTMPVDGVFIAIGFDPNTEVFKEKLELTERNYISVFDGGKTSKPGVFAAGDITDPRFQQAISAAGAACDAAISCIRFLDIGYIES